MQTLSTAIRATALVLGIAALASLMNRMVADSGLHFWLLMKQQTLPGALWGVSAAEHLTYGIAVIFLCQVVARGYWRSLFPERINALWLLASFALGVLFAMFLNHPMHAFLFDVFFGKPIFTGGAVSDSVASTIFTGLSGYKQLFTFSAFATIVLSPFVEELTDRGILFKEASTMPLWQIAILSFLVFCVSHYAIGGIAKVLAVVPAAVLFVAVRWKTGSFAYSAAAHIAMNLAAMLKLQVF
jgi:hypothetical protein